jgi:hypothetical protein
MSHLRLLACLLPILLLFSSGCGDSGPVTVPVTGQVIFDGEPISEGEILFRATDGTRSYAGKIKDGTYSVEVSPGAKRVEITAYRDVPGKFREDNPGERTPVREMYIPERYNSATTLTIEVSPDGQEENFELTSAKK